MEGILNMDRLSWDEMVEKYPDQWIAVKDAEMDGADIMSGEVVTAQSDEEMREFRIKHRGDGYVFRRTSDCGFNGHITSNLRIRVDQTV